MKFGSGKEKSRDRRIEPLLQVGENARAPTTYIAKKEDKRERSKSGELLAVTYGGCWRGAPLRQGHRRSLEREER